MEEETPVVEAVSTGSDELVPKSVTGILHRMSDVVSYAPYTWWAPSVCLCMRSCTRVCVRACIHMRGTHSVHCPDLG